MISEELDELFEICDRIAVIAKGRLSPAKPTAETSVEEIGVWMSGLWPGAYRRDCGAAGALMAAAGARMLRLEARPEPSHAMRYASPLIAVALTLIGGIIIFAALGRIRSKASRCSS